VPGDCAVDATGLVACCAPGTCALAAAAGCEFAVGELPLCGLVAGEPATGGDSLCAFDASGAADCAVPDAAPGCTAGCSGPLGCGMAGPLLSESVRECESSPKLIVYDLNGGSSDEVGAEPADVGAEGPLGPDNSSGTNNTIRTTRMIAPVSRSFTRSSTVGTKPPQSS